MSEKIYAWLLRLYPSRFRQEYGDAAMQLFRDRSRHERGLLSALRLWLDLFTDLAISVPLQYRDVEHALATGTTARPSISSASRDLRARRANAAALASPTNPPV